MSRLVQLFSFPVSKDARTSLLVSKEKVVSKDTGLLVSAPYPIV